MMILPFKQLSYNFMRNATMEENVQEETKHYENVQRHHLLPMHIELCITDAADSTGPMSSDESSSVDTTLRDVTRAVRLLYVSHTLARSSELAWQFGVVLILSQTVSSESSLILLSTYGASVKLAVVLTAGRCGRAIDRGNAPDENDDDYDDDTGSKNVPPRRNRWQTIRRFIVAENFAVLVATGACLVLLQSTTNVIDNDDDDNNNTDSSAWDSLPTDARSIACLVVIHVMGALAQVLDQTLLVAMERDWVVVMCQTAARALSVINNSAAAVAATTIANAGELSLPSDAIWTAVPTGDDMERNSTNDGKDPNSEPDTGDNNVKESVFFQQWLSSTNVSMKQIDLSCKVAAPAAAGLLFPLLSSPVMSAGEIDNETVSTALDYRWACWTVGMLTGISLLVEYICTYRIYQLVPALACRREPSTETRTVSLPATTQFRKECDPMRQTIHLGERNGWMPQDLRVYFEQKSAMGGLGLAFLYLNPLTFGNGVMMAYLLSRGMHLAVVGSLRGLSSLIGLLGTVAYHFSVKYQSPEATCLWSVLYQSLCLGISFASLLAFPTDSASLGLLVGGVCASRIGLWVYDIGITQMQQEQVPGAVRGQVGGTQQSLNACFNLLSFGLGFVCPDPKDFVMYVFTAFSSISIAAYLYATGVYNGRRHSSNVLYQIDT